jgi:hypothetical protein
MAFVSPEYVKQTQLKHQLVYWKITDKTKETNFLFIHQVKHNRIIKKFT